jgi:putative transcription factor
MMLRADYSAAIKGARESLGITQEELGKKINEKPSMIGHLEVGSMKPDDLLARKLEHFLKIQLFVPVEDEMSTSSP